MPERATMIGREICRGLEAIEQADGNQRQATRLLGISRATFARKIEKLGISIKLETRPMTLFRGQ